jgi:hypothetical protein
MNTARIGPNSPRRERNWHVPRRDHCTTPPPRRSEARELPGLRIEHVARGPRRLLLPPARTPMPAMNPWSGVLGGGPGWYRTSDLPRVRRTLSH